MDDVFEVPAALEGERLDRALALLTGLSRSEIDAVIAEGNVTVGSAGAASRSRRLRAGETVRVAGGIKARQKAAPAGEAAVVFRVVWHDSEVVVVDKPAGLVVHPGAGNRVGTLVNGLLALFPDMAALSGEEETRDRPGVVHRLDKGTSGLVVFARTPRALASLQKQMARRTAGREYLALVAGDVESEAGVIDAPLGRSANDPVRMRVQSGGKGARTGYEVLERFAAPAACCLLRCRLETGRTHQIRVHFASIGHPVVGDERYGTRRLGTWEPLPAGRQFLHAARLSFEHPSTGERETFEAPLPEDLEEVLSTMRRLPSGESRP